MNEVQIVNANLARIPTGYHKYLDTSYEFKISKSYPSIEIETDDNCDFLRARIFYDGKSHEIYPTKVVNIPESLYLKIKTGNKPLNIFIDKKTNPNLFEAGKGFEESKSSNKRVHKYMSLFKSYEALTNRYNRNLDFTAVRHCLSHSSNSLTKQNVLDKLTDLLDRLQ